MALKINPMRCVSRWINPSKPLTAARELQKTIPLKLCCNQEITILVASTLAALFGARDNKVRPRV